MSDDFRAKLAHRLREARTRIGYTQREAARLAGLARREALTEIEAGRRKVSTEDLVGLCHVYGLQTGDVLAFDQPLPELPVVHLCYIDESVGAALRGEEVGNG